MDLKREIKVGDYVMCIENGRVVCDEEGIPLKVIQIRGLICPYTLANRIWVFYSDGGFDYLSKVEVAPSLLLELL